MNINKTSRRHFNNLDSLRLLAMVTVFSTHCYFLEDNPETASFYNKYFKFSGIGVEFFIILSGFFASYTYKTCPYKEYISKKIKRIIPTHWLCLIFGMYLSGLQHVTSGISTPLSFLGLNTLIPVWDCSNPASWTISTLLVLYSITPILVAFLNKLGHERLLIAAYVLAVISTAINYYLYSPQNKIFFWFLYISPYYRILTYTIGLLLGAYYKYYQQTERSMNLKNSIIELSYFFMMWFFIAIFDKGAGFWYTVPIILLISLSVKGEGIVSYVLNWQILVKLAKYSFSFYMIHFPILSMVRYLVLEFQIENVTTLYLICLGSFIICFGLSIPLHYYIENKFLNVNIAFIEKVKLN